MMRVSKRKKRKCAGDQHLTKMLCRVLAFGSIVIKIGKDEGSVKVAYRAALRRQGAVRECFATLSVFCKESP